MILKKPYAFLIKHFRLIHLLLVLLLSGIAYTSLPVVEFFNKYVKSGYRTGVTEGLATQYTPFLLYLLVFVAISILATLMVLMVHKKKPTKLYLFSIIYYLAIFIGLFVISGILDSFSSELIDAKLARSVRDILVIAYIPQFLIIFLSLIRAIGFNIKKFDFQNDLREMNLNAADAQEIEVKIEVDYDKIARKFNHIFRELGYYLKENLYMVAGIATVIAVLIGYSIYNYVTTDYNKKYSEGSSFTYNNVQFTVNDTIVTNLNYKGKVIEKGSYFVVIDLSSINNTSKSIKMDYNNIKLQIGDNLYNPDLTRNSEFIDYLPGNVETILVSNREYRFALIYEIPESSKNSSMKLSLYTGTREKGDDLVNTYIYAKLNPEVLADTSVSGNFGLNEEVTFSDTYVQNDNKTKEQQEDESTNIDTKLTVLSYDITKSYIYEYKSCDTNKNCNNYKDRLDVALEDGRQDNVLLIIKANFTVDPTTNYGASYKKLRLFADNFCHIEYKVGDTTYTKSSIHVTPTNIGGLMAFEVPNNIKDASIIQLTINIRNHVYYVNLK